jgi:hypothetical protein
MNCFEFLGLAPDYRKEGKIVQLVKNLEEVSEKKISYPLIGQIKHDGVFGMIIATGTHLSIFGRTGKRLSNLERLCKKYSHLKAGVYIGEVCLPGKSLEVLSGIVNPNRTKDIDTVLGNYFITHVEIHFYDHLTIEEFIHGKSLQRYTHRQHRLRLHGVPCIGTHLIHSYSELESFAKGAIDEGQEGVVLKHDADWEAGHKGWRSMKKVRRVEYDLLCVDTEEGKGKYAGKVANLIFKWKDGDTIKAMLGKNYTHEDAQYMFEFKENDPVGRIYAVYGLQDSSKGKIRLPKVGELRHDKAEPDF